MGHISLVVPVVHIWYFRSLPSKIGYLLGIPTKMLDAVIYYERYIVVQPGAAAELGVSEKDLLAEKEYLDILAQLPKGNAQLDDDDPNKFIALMGAEAIDLMLRRLDLDTLSYSLRHKASTGDLAAAQGPKPSRGSTSSRRSASRAKSTNPNGWC